MLSHHRRDRIAHSSKWRKRSVTIPNNGSFQLRDVWKENAFLFHHVGLEFGADDYVTKPFGLAELRSRIRAVLRRGRTWTGASEILTVGQLALDRGTRAVTMRGEAVNLTFSEFELLSHLMSEPGRLFNRQELMRAIWGDSAYRDPRGIDVHVRHLREKLEETPESPRLILTVRGAGYRLQRS